MIDKKIELLAPAGNMESLKAAVQSGADAVYLGGSKFSARAYAANFTDEIIKDAVEYCHFNNVKIYVTVNTLLKDEEIIEALEYINYLYNIGVDAIIIQDLGLAALVKSNIKNMELHASTQMTVHNLEGAKFLRNNGFKRIVLARELSIKEISNISKEEGLDTEIFIHGALCISYSGQCLMSSIIGGRSGNRGRCAQPCRLPYEIVNRLTKESKKGYIMSPKDMCTLENISDIIKSGASSLKIEGRMKKSEYVAGVVGAYRRAIDNYYSNSYIDIKEEVQIAKQLFNREGFSKAYLYHNDGIDMMAYNFPKNTGLYLGEALKDKSIILNENLNVRDGVRIKDDGFVVASIIKDSKEVSFAEKGDIVVIKPSKYKSGDILYKTLDNKLIEQLSLFYKDTFRKYNIKLNVKFKCDEAIEIETNVFNREFIAIGDIIEKPINKPLEKENIIKNLSKSGDTFFNIEQIEFSVFEEGFMPISSINKVRRELIEKITEYKNNLNNTRIPNKLATEDLHINKLSINNNNHNNKSETMPSLLVTITNNAQLDGVKYVRDNSNSDIAICINPFMKRFNIDLNTIKMENMYMKVPNIIKDTEFNNCCCKIDKYLNKFKGIVTSNLGIINKYYKSTDIILDYKGNVFNSYIGHLYNDLKGVYLSSELNKNELKTLMDNVTSKNNIGIVVYGRYELMVSEYCPIGAFFGNKDNKQKCEGPCKQGRFYLKDRMKEEFPIYNDEYCRSYILNGSITNLIPFKKDLKAIGIDNFRVDFTDEQYDDVITIINNAIGINDTMPDFNYTKGHYKRGVE